MKNENDEIQQNLEEEESKLIISEDETVDDDNLASTNKHTSKYEGPITRSKTKGEEDVFLLKANKLMSRHFNDN